MSDKPPVPPERKRLAVPIKGFNFQYGPPDGVSEEESDAALQPFFKKISLIASHWSFLEIALDQTIWHLANVVPHKGACITAQFGSTYFRVKAIAALVEQIPNSEDLLKKINQFSGTMEPIVRKRNRAIHDPILYSVQSKEVSVYTITADRKLVYGLTTAVLDDYDRTMKGIITLRESFEALKTEIFQHAASPEIPK